ncbi:App1 family protein [Xenophilus arseniciresistens]|uniref:App1 family protein n=1 Tax=Xenophilus arseniciresistens TaxID=1283306 RepID=A0AAE3SZ08_9BURK|nr:App1 family protein [Xenophilus arseniciresistens]MDA7415341.1 App1 family protein [Xenophilus arseniciresistens]
MEREAPAPCGAATRRHLLQRAALLAALMAAWPGRARARALRADEQVLFVPAIARWLDAQRVEVDIHAWVYERERRRGVQALFARYLGLDRATLPAEDRARFDARCALFLTDSERAKVVDLVFDAPLQSQPHALPPTDAAGRSQARIVLDARALPPDARTVGFRAQLTEGDARQFLGHALLVPEDGLSVVSDIDDTVKITQVNDRREMLLNTFVRPFQAAPGLSAHFRRLAKAEGTRFHYLSASPFQLAPALEDFLQTEAFPAGSLHLRESTRWNTLIPGSGDSRAHKLGVIERLLADFPRRRFLLVGDSGEADPEIYAQVARQHPTRIAAIVIRDVQAEGRAAARFVQNFAGLPEGLWHLLPPEGEPWPQI